METELTVDCKSEAKADGHGNVEYRLNFVEHCGSVSVPKEIFDHVSIGSKVKRILEF